MSLRRLTLAALLAFLPAAASAQSAGPVVAAASKAMGADTLNSITYSGTARNGAFGQSKAIGDPMGGGERHADHAVHADHQLRHAGRRRRRWSRGPRGRRSRRRCPACPPPMPGVFNQNITAMQASSNWNQALNIWTTPWGFLKGAAANNATVRQQGGQQVVSFSPALKSPSGQAYTVTGYINSQNLVTKVETRVDNAVVGDLLVEFEYSNYQNMNGVQVPTRIVQRQAGMPTFDADDLGGDGRIPPNLAELLTAPPPPGRAGGRADRRRERRPPPRPADRRWRSSVRARSRSAATTRRWPWTWATTSWWSRAARATRAVWP